MKSFISNSVLQTRKLAAKIAKLLRGGETIALFGNLGVGKTEFVKGLAAALGIKKIIVSPTFLFLKSYNLSKLGRRRKLHHFDLYRLRNVKDFLSMGLDEPLHQTQDIKVIEWPEKIRKLSGRLRINIYFKHGEKQNQRVIKFPRLLL